MDGGDGARQAIRGRVDRTQDAVTQRHILTDQVGQGVDRHQGVLELGEQVEERQMVGRKPLAFEDGRLADKRAVKIRKAEVAAILKIVPCLDLLRHQGERIRAQAGHALLERRAIHGCHVEREEGGLLHEW